MLGGMSFQIHHLIKCQDHHTNYQEVQCTTLSSSFGGIYNQISFAGLLSQFLVKMSVVGPEGARLGPEEAENFEDVSITIVKLDQHLLMRFRWKSSLL